MCTTRWITSKCCRLVADALKDSVAEIRKDEENRIARFAFPQVFNEARLD